MLIIPLPLRAGGAGCGERLQATSGHPVRVREGDKEQEAVQGMSHPQSVRFYCSGDGLKSTRPVGSGAATYTA
jgi:hypothetical protein